MVMTDIAGQISEGTEVYGADGEKLGKVAAVEADSVVVEKGFFFPTDYYIPMSAFASVEDGSAYLNVTKEQALDQIWDVATATETYATTADAAPVATGTVDLAASGGAIGRDRGEMMDDAGAAVEHAQNSDRSHRNTDEGLRLPVHQEELTATTRQREIGEVRVEKDVVAEERTLQVPVTEERVRVERHVVDRPVGAADADAFQEGVIEVPIRGEEVELQKQVRVAEEVEIGKEAVQRTERVAGTVRHEEVQVTEDAFAGTTPNAAGTDRTPMR